MGGNKFRIGITRDNLRADGKPIFDASVLDMLADPIVEWEFMESPEMEVSPGDAQRYDAICAMLTRITRKSLAGNQRLKLIARFGVGYDSIDVPALTEAGVLLTIAPDGVRRPVAMAAVTFVLALAQKLLIKDRLTRAGRWQDKLDHIGTGLSGRVLGMLGIGNIGAEVLRLIRPFDMTPIAHDPFATPSHAALLGAELVEFDMLFRRADFLVVACPLNERTRGIVDARALALMKPSAYLVNIARGPIVDETALIEALGDKRIAGAGLDVFETEPTPSSNPLLGMENVIVTPHGICFTDECLAGLARSAFGAALDVAHGKVPPHLVNRDALGHKRLAALRG
ncbi:MAG: dehydrogenase [Proteobacteria bacterium]|nr:dehydrogenase [Pseudomonadota bacterium]MBI3498081.1 dehydrogenase [Pseudomonadota bacterium]